MDSLYGQAVCLCVLGGARGCVAGGRALTLDLPAVFQHSRDHGLEPSSLNQIAREWAPRLDISEADVRNYLTENIHYQLDAGCLEGLQLFYRYAAEIGALPASAGADGSWKRSAKSRAEIPQGKLTCKIKALA